MVSMALLSNTPERINGYLQAEFKIHIFSLPNVAKVKVLGDFYIKTCCIQILSKSYEKLEDLILVVCKSIWQQLTLSPSRRSTHCPDYPVLKVNKELNFYTLPISFIFVTKLGPASIQLRTYHQSLPLPVYNSLSYTNEYCQSLKVERKIQSFFKF